MGMRHCSSVDPEMSDMSMVVGHVEDVGSNACLMPLGYQGSDRNAEAMNDRLVLLRAGDAEVTMVRPQGTSMPSGWNGKVPMVWHHVITMDGRALLNIGKHWS
jgi:hypothetical protein